jgi:hypothetical protein
MSYDIHEIDGSIFNVGTPASANSLVEAIHANGLGLKINLDGSFTPSPASVCIDALGGAENDSNLRLLTAQMSQLRNLATYVIRQQFRQNVLEYVQSGNRSVESALRNLCTGVNNMLDFLRNFLGKDIKLPVKYLWMSNTSTDYGREPELIYTEEQTGNYHTLQELGQNQAYAGWSTYLEDTPTLRRYLRFIDSVARQSGMRVLYCPKEFNHPDELAGTPTRPNWTQQNGAVVRSIRDQRYKALFVSLFFDYTMFRDLTVIETDAQPGQRPRPANQMDYGPIFVDNLASIVKVLTTIGGFAACKIYYKDYRNSARSSQAAQ